MYRILLAALLVSVTVMYGCSGQGGRCLRTRMTPVFQPVSRKRSRQMLKRQEGSRAVPQGTGLPRSRS